VVPDNKYAQGQLYDEQALRDVVQMERQAQEIIRDAEQRGRRMVAEARASRDEMLVAAHQKAERKRSERLAAEERWIAEKVAEIELSAEHETQAWLGRAQCRLDQAVSYVVRLVTLAGGE